MFCVVELTKRAEFENKLQNSSIPLLMKTLLFQSIIQYCKFSSNKCCSINCTIKSRHRQDCSDHNVQLKMYYRYFHESQMTIQMYNWTLKLKFHRVAAEKNHVDEKCSELFSVKKCSLLCLWVYGKTAFMPR